MNTNIGRESLVGGRWYFEALFHWCLRCLRSGDFIILSLSGIASALFAMINPFIFYPDSEQYLLSAMAIIGDPHGKFYYYRTLGYPLLMLLCGTIYFGSLIPLIVVQYCASAVVPWLVYRTILQIAPRYALICGTLCIVSLSPYYLSSVIMTDQLSMTLMYMAILFVVRYIYFNRLGDILIVVACVFFWMTMRPAATLAYVAIVIPLFCLLGKRVWNHIMMSIACLLLAVWFNGFLGKEIVSGYNKRVHAYEKIDWASFSGKMFFWNIYGPGALLTGRNTILLENGPYSRKMFDVLVQWGRENPLGIQSYLKTDDPIDYARRVMGAKDLFSHSLIWRATDEILGPKEADRLCWFVALEGLWMLPTTALLFWDGTVDFFMNGDVVYNGGERLAWNARGLSESRLLPYIPATIGIPESIKQELRNSFSRVNNRVGERRLLRLGAGLFYWQTAIKIIAVLVCVALGGLLWRAPCLLRVTAAVLLSLILYQAVICSLFASPHFRYIVPMIPAFLMLATCCMEGFRVTRRQETLPVAGMPDNALETT